MNKIIIKRDWSLRSIGRDEAQAGNKRIGFQRVLDFWILKPEKDEKNTTIDKERAKIQPIMPKTGLIARI